MLGLHRGLPVGGYSNQTDYWITHIFSIWVNSRGIIAKKIEQSSLIFRLHLYNLVIKMHRLQLFKIFPGILNQVESDFRAQIAFIDIAFPGRRKTVSFYCPLIKPPNSMGGSQLVIFESFSRSNYFFTLLFSLHSFRSCSGFKALHYSSFVDPGPTSGLNLFLLAPHTGQHQFSSSSSKQVPFWTLPLRSPRSGS